MNVYRSAEICLLLFIYRNEGKCYSIIALNSFNAGKCKERCDHINYTIILVIKD